MIRRALYHPLDPHSPSATHVLVGRRHEHREHQQERPHHLAQEGTADRDAGGDGVDAEREGWRRWHSAVECLDRAHVVGAEHEGGAEDPTKALRQYVEQAQERAQAGVTVVPEHDEGRGHGGVYVAAGDGRRRERQDGDAGPEGERHRHEKGPAQLATRMQDRKGL